MSQDQTLFTPIIRSPVTDLLDLDEVKFSFSGPERSRGSFNSTSCQEWGQNIPLKIIVDFGPLARRGRDRSN